MPMFFGIRDSREDFTAGQSVGMASAAYSFRLLNTAYSGNCIKARRSSDSATLDVGFVSGSVDLASLEAWAGADTVTIDTWYDQSGNGRNATQAAGASQPRFYDAGVMESINSAPALFFNGSGYNLNRDSGFLEGVFYAFAAVTLPNGGGASQWFTGTSPGTNNTGLQIGFNGSNAFKIAQWNNDANYTPTWSTGTAYAHAGKKNTPAGSSLWQNGTLVADNATLPGATQLQGGATTFYIGAGGGPSYFDGLIAELIMWSYAISSSQLLVMHNNQKTYFAL